MESFAKGDGHNQVQIVYADTPESETKIRSKLASKGSNYRPRTHHLLKNGVPQFTNRLILEDSPYLQQHAHNPVNWYPWGKQAFTKARNEGKPIFLSIGYSTCHWCHVMEKESYDNIEIAEILNQHFVSIKVDRERRPATDATYMTAVQLMTGQGGWPLNSFLTPNGGAFFGGTYFPPEHFKNLLLRVHQLWNDRRGDLIASAQQVAAMVEKFNASAQSTQKIELTTIKQAVTTILRNQDVEFGGFGSQPKFPHEPLLFLLLEHALRSGDTSTLETITNTLDALSQGGIYDQIGGGFHRYSTDRAWRVPHFEKMLYNQSQLSRVFVRAYALTGDWTYRRTAQQTLNFTIREMAAPGGGFYSAMDADSEGQEGLYYLWTSTQLQEILTPPEIERVEQIFGITPAGDLDGKNILYLPTDLASFSERQNVSHLQFLSGFDTLRDKLRRHRGIRIPPLTDTKIITAWNGMMITALCEAGAMFKEPLYTDQAINTAEFIWSKNRTAKEGLNRIYWDGNSSIPAQQDDYAFLAEGFLCLYDSTRNSLWLDRTQQLADILIKRFWDDRSGGFFMSDKQSDPLLFVQPKDKEDGAIPSANSVAFRVLALLSKRTANLNYESKAKATLAAFSDQIANHPSAFGYMLSAVYEFLYGESGANQYAAKGAVKISGFVENNHMTVTINLQPGWHINAHQPLQKYLIATEIAVEPKATNWTLGRVNYPQPERQTLGFSQQPLLVYSNQVQLESTITRKSDASPIIPLSVNLQACNDKSCLPPENVHLNISSIR